MAVDISNENEKKKTTRKGERKIVVDISVYHLAC